MFELFLSAFVTFFVVVDPPGCAPIYAGLTKGASAQQRRNMALRACLIAAAILLVFALFGVDLLAALHIELDSFRIAGGLMLFWIAWEMVFEKRTQRREERAEKIAASPEVEDVSVFPMAMPMLAGPGAIAAIMLLMNEADSVEEMAVVLGALASVLTITAVALIAAGPLMRLFGDKVESVIPPARRAARGAGRAICDRRPARGLRALTSPTFRTRAVHARLGASGATSLAGGAYVDQDHRRDVSRLPAGQRCGGATVAALRSGAA